MRKQSTADRELREAQKHAMRAWDDLERRREQMLEGLRMVEDEIYAMQPLVCALFGRAEAA